MGWATWVIEFPRLSGDQTALIGDHRVGAGVEERERVTGEGRDEVPEGVRLLDSVARATDYLRTLAKSESLDLDRIVTLGHSSGGHLALWVAARGTIDGPVAGGSSTPLRIAGAITLAGIVDLRTFEGLPVRGCGDRVRQLLDDDFSPEQLAATSPGAMLPLGVPQLLISGGVDTTVPPHHGSEYSERALSAGDRVEHRVIPRADHFELVAPWTAGGQEVEGAIREFLNGVRRLPPSARGSP